MSEGISAGTSPQHAARPLPHRATGPRCAASAATWALLAAVLLGAPLTGCYSWHVYQVGGPDGRELGNQPSTEWRSRTLHAFAWGAVRQDLPVDNCQLSNGQRLGIEEVKVDTNLGFLLASTVTLGLWVPLQVSWRCARPPVTGGPLRDLPPLRS